VGRKRITFAQIVCQSREIRARGAAAAHMVQRNIAEIRTFPPYFKGNKPMSPLFFRLLPWRALVGYYEGLTTKLPDKLAKLGAVIWFKGDSPVKSEQVKI